MSGTKLDLTLTADRLAEWKASEVTVYAALFQGSAAGIVTTLVSDGTVTAAGTLAGVDETYTIPLTNGGTSTLDGGKLYIVAESGTTDISSVITDQSNINPNTAAADDFAYDSIEVTLLNTSGDAANLTSVNGFALPMKLSDSYGSVGYNVPGSTIVSDISAISSGAISAYNSGGLLGQFRMATSPTAVNLAGTVSTTGPYPQAAWEPYVAAMETIAPQVTISGQFNGAPDAKGVWHNGGYYAYALSWDATEGVFWLSPTANSQIQGYIALTPQAIEQNIYSQIGSVSIYSAASISPTTLLETVPVGSNTQWGAVLAQFLTGFTGGYYGQAGASPNPQVGGTVGLDQNNDWNPIYAFNENLGSVVNIGGGGVQYDPYSKVFFDNSNSYGSPYSDLLMSQFTEGGPLLSVANASGTDVSSLNLTIFGQTETPTGYVTPTIHDYIAAPGGTYAPATTLYPGNVLDLNFFSAVAHNEGVQLDPNATVTLSILTGDTGGTPSWTTVTLDGGTTAGGLFQTWTLTPDGHGGYTASAGGASGSPGYMVIAGLPTAASGVSWYQVAVAGSNGSNSKTFNLYATTGSSGQIENPAYAGQSGALAIDGLASVAPTGQTTPYVNFIKVNFATGDTVAFNPALAVAVTGSGSFPKTPPSAVIADISNNGTISALAGESNAGGTITTAHNEFLLGWAGYNTNDVTVTDNVIQNGSHTTAPGGTGWAGSAVLNPSVPAGDTVVSVASVSGIGAYTNLVNADDYAAITVHAAGGGSKTFDIQADVNGDWVSPTASFGAGTYTITMAGAVEQNGTYAQTTQESAPLVLDVTNGAPGILPNEFILSCFAAGTAIETADGPRPVESLAAGNVVRTISGALQEIRWVGHRTVDCARHPTPAAVRPVRIAAHAFGPGLPARALDLSPDHAVYAEGVLVPVKYLINGTTIRQRRVKQVTYHHIELDAHDVILAEGLPAETYLDTGDRASFANAQGAVALHPAWGSEARDILLIMDALGAAPLRVTGPEVARLQARLAATAAAMARSA